MRLSLQKNTKLFLLSIIIVVANTAKSQFPILNSINNAGPTTPTIFLDFDGHVVNGTSWNYSGPIICDSSGLNASQVIDVFNRVSEDYRPYNINVTTDSVKYLNAPINQRIRVVLTPSWQWYCGTTACAGGVAFTGSFAWGDNTPCFVFTLGALGQNIKNISEATSHESGHTLGLYHQSKYDTACTKTADYSTGQGTGEIGWAPIMGVGYTKNLTTWHNGPNPYGCTNYQDDKTIITSVTNGVTYKIDDYGNTTTNAYQPAFTSQNFSQSGLIEQNTDKDVFSFILATGGTLHVDANPYNVGVNNTGADLDIELKLLDASGNILQTYNPPTLLNASIDTSLNAGTYFIEIDGVGNAYTTDYGVLGSYTLSGTYSGSVTAPSACQLITITHSITPDDGSTNGAIGITVTGSTNPLTYAWSNGSTVQDINNLTNGIYTVTINDAIDACFIQKTYTVLLNTNCTSVINSSVVSTFETGLDIWNQSTSDGMDWTRWTGTTPTNNTGPLSGAYEGSYYLYTEATGNQNKTAILESNCIDLRNAINPTWDFYYSMRGVNIGSLAWGIVTLNGTYTQLGIMNGAQAGGAWTLKSQSLSSYTGNIIRLRFTGTTKTSDKGDIAIDYVNINPNGPVVTSIHDDYWEDGLILFPNPNSGQFTIVLQKQETLTKVNIEVYSITGQKMKEYSHSDINNTFFEQDVNINELADGMYMVRITNNNKSHTFKIAKYTTFK